MNLFLCKNRYSAKPLRVCTPGHCYFPMCGGEMQAYIMGHHLPGGRQAGKIQVLRSEITFQSGDYHLHFSLAQSQVQKGGASNRLWMIHSDLYPDLTLCLTSGPWLKEVNAQAAELHSSWRDLQSKSLKKIWMAMALLVISLGALLGLWFSKDALVYALARQIPVSWEVKLSETQLQAMSLSQGFSKDSVALAQIRTLGEPLVLAAQSEPGARIYSYQWRIANDPSVNAFAMPGGIVVVNSGLILKASTPEEIQGVLAHEIAHAQAQHGMRNVMSSLGLMSLLSIVTGGAEGLVGVVAGHGGQLLSLKFSRDFERDADEKGFGYLVRQKVNPQGMLSFFQKLMDQPKGKIAEAMEGYEILSTHPATAERISRLQALEQTVQGQSWTQAKVDLKALQLRVQTLR